MIERFHSIDKARKVYILRGSKGHCDLWVGFEYAFAIGTAIAQWLRARGERVETPLYRNVGTELGCRDYLEVLRAEEVYRNRTGIECPKRPLVIFSSDQEKEEV